MEIKFESIGTIHTPYLSVNTPYQPIENAPGEFWIVLEPKYKEGLKDLDKYNYIFVLYYMDQIKAQAEMTVNPSWTPETEVGLFASRSPIRPNPIGLSIVKIKEIIDNEIIISGIDTYNGTPLLDIKPYVKSLDQKTDANDGWYDDLENKDHLIAHMLGLPHDHGQSNVHDNHGHHSHGHSHTHTQSQHSHSHND